MSLRSMTGFAAVRRTFESAEIFRTLKSVNHRSLDIHFHMPAEFDCFEAALRPSRAAAFTSGCTRGSSWSHVMVNR